MKDDVKTKDGIQVIARAAAVLRALKDCQTGLSLGQIAERVALLDEGRVVAFGTHEELLRGSSRYADVLAAQERRESDAKAAG